MWNNYRVTIDGLLAPVRKSNCRSIFGAKLFDQLLLIRPWCNGSTSGSDPENRGSSPCGRANPIFFSNSKFSKYTLDWALVTLATSTPLHVRGAGNKLDVFGQCTSSIELTRFKTLHS